MASKVKQNFHAESEDGINRQINMELHASYVCLSQSYYFDRDDVALHGFAKYFRKISHEKREHAEKLMKYMNMRGGRIILQAVQKPVRDEWGSGKDAMSTALDLEKDVNIALLDLHATASKHNDEQMCDFLESEYLEVQVEAIKELADYVTNLKRAGSGLGEHIFDKETLKGDED